MDVLGLGLGLPSSDLRRVGDYGEMGSIAYGTTGYVDEIKRYLKGSIRPSGTGYNQQFTDNFAWYNYPNGANWDVKFVSVSVSCSIKSSPDKREECFDQFVLYNSADHTYNQTYYFYAYAYQPFFPFLEATIPGISNSFLLYFNVAKYESGGNALDKQKSMIPEGGIYIQYNAMMVDYLFN